MIAPAMHIATEDGRNVNTARAVNSLSEAVQVRTVSFSDRTLVDLGEFDRFHALLERLYPLTHERLHKTAIGHSLFYLWKGSDTAQGDRGNQGKRPVALMSHMDVVPADEEGWEYPPFSGAVADGYVWGRGSIDMKFGLITILEAIEELLEEGFVPHRDIYMISTCDEETGGQSSICQIAERLGSEEVRFDWVLDEGGVVGEGMMSGVDKPLAAVGVAEKGYLDLELSVGMEGGHSSMPGRTTSVGLLSQAIARLAARQMPSRLVGPVREFFKQVSPHVGLGRRLVFANTSLFAPLIKRVMLGSPETAAMIRTTTAPTMISGSAKPNVLAARASAVVNFRLLPGDTVRDVVSHVTKVVGDNRVEIKVLAESPASTVSPMDGLGFRLIEKCIGQHYPDAVVVPYLLTGSTDSKSLEPLASGVYRFTPCRLTKKDITRMHGVNERVSTENIEKAVRFFKTVITKL
ncbi:MAG: M20/M25/M40 family metallo-hydrolase [Firmicutes bacterium]|nr:M20/M25/M40 family metallo-hydrolase [Bacillota bacterium]